MDAPQSFRFSNSIYSYSTTSEQTSWYQPNINITKAAETQQMQKASSLLAFIFKKKETISNIYPEQH